MMLRFSVYAFWTLLIVFFSAQTHAEEGHRHEDSHAHEKKDKATGDHSDDHGASEDHDDDHGDHETHDDDQEGHDDHGAEAIGEDKAIVEVMDEGNKFRLHAESIKFLDLKYASISQLKEHEFMIPSSALVRFQNHTGVYRVTGEDLFEMIHLDVLAENEDGSRVKSKHLKGGDRLAVSQLGNLRAAQLQASGQGGEGHAH